MSGPSAAGSAERTAAMLARYRAPVLDGMRAALDRPEIRHLDLVRYHLGWQDADGNAADAPTGKMLRPALCLLCCEASGGDVEDALPAAVAIELLHNFTLIHDDIEDRSDTRHGRPTLWRVAGVELAINAGDGLFALAHRTLLALSETGHPAESVLEAARILDDASIALCEGQHADICFEQKSVATAEEYEAMIGGKTAALLGAAAAIGALCGGAPGPAVQAYAMFGLLLGLAFQVQDDVLGIWGEANITGKPVADDIRSRKKSYPVVFALGRLGQDERAEVERLYAADAIGDAGVERVLAMLDGVDARGASLTAARQWADAALATIRPLVDDAERMADVDALAEFFVQRQS